MRLQGMPSSYARAWIHRHLFGLGRPFMQNVTLWHTRKDLNSPLAWSRTMSINRLGESACQWRFCKGNRSEG